MPNLQEILGFIPVGHKPGMMVQFLSQSYHLYIVSLLGRQKQKVLKFKVTLKCIASLKSA